MAVISKGQQEDFTLVQERIDAFYPDLVECKATFSVLLISPSESQPERPPLMKDGYPVAGKIYKSAFKDRVLGKPDLVLELDAQNWCNISEDKKRGEVDHQLSSIIVLRDRKTKAIKTDDRSRPLFRKRPHDKEVGIYDEVVRRHGRNAPESFLVEELSLHYNTLLPPDGNKSEEPETVTE